jgi:hypothetical protein
MLALSRSLRLRFLTSCPDLLPEKSQEDGMTEFEKFIAKAQRLWGRKIAAEAARLVGKFQPLRTLLIPY